MGHGVGVRVSLLLGRGGSPGFSGGLHLHGEGRDHLMKMKVLIPYMAASDTPVGVLRCLIIASRVWKSRLENTRDRNGDLEYRPVFHKLVIRKAARD